MKMAKTIADGGVKEPQERNTEAGQELQSASSEPQIETQVETSGASRAMGNRVSTALQSVGAVGGDALGITRDVLRDAISATEDVGADLVGGIRHVAKDVVYSVNDVGSDIAAVVKDGAYGALNAVGEVGAHTVTTLTHLLVGVVGGVKQVAGAAVGGAKNVWAENKSQVTPANERQAEDEAVQVH